MPERAARRFAARRPDRPPARGNPCVMKDTELKDTAQRGTRGDDSPRADPVARPPGATRTRVGVGRAGPSPAPLVGAVVCAAWHF